MFGGYCNDSIICEDYTMDLDCYDNVCDELKGNVI